MTAATTFEIGFTVASAGAAMYTAFFSDAGGNVFIQTMMWLLYLSLYTVGQVALWV